MTCYLSYWWYLDLQLHLNALLFFFGLFDLKGVAIAAWSIICKRRTTRRHLWFQIAARQLPFLQGKQRKLQCWLLSTAKIWYVNFFSCCGEGGSFICSRLCFSWCGQIDGYPTCLWLFLFLYSNCFLFQGLAYQLIDDVLDFTGTSASLGKGSLSDIRHVIILSLIWYLMAGDDNCC